MMSSGRQPHILESELVESLGNHTPDEGSISQLNLLIRIVKEKYLTSYKEESGADYL